MSVDTALPGQSNEIPVSIAYDRGGLLRAASWVWAIVAAVFSALLGLLLLGLVIVLGLVVVPIVVVVFVIVGLRWIWAMVIVVVNGLFGRVYPVSFAFPLSREGSRLVLNNSFNASLGNTLSFVARGAILILGPIVLCLRLFVGWSSSRIRREHPVVDIDIPRSRLFSWTLRSAIDIAGTFGWLRDGFEEAVSSYDTWIEHGFPEIGAFVKWWPDLTKKVSSYSYTPPSSASARPGDLRMFGKAAKAIPRQLSPDPRGFPGLASAVIRRKEIRGLRDLFTSAREIDDMCDPDLDDTPNGGVVRIVRTGAGRGERWIVQIASTQSWNPVAGTAPNDLTADLLAVSGRESALLRGTLVAMAQARVPLDRPVLVTGFSLGGLIAAQLATGRYIAPGKSKAHRYTHLIAAGSPIARFPLTEGISVLSLEHKIDPVHRLDGRAKYTNRDSQSWTTVTAGPRLPVDYSVGQTHHAPSYAETGAHLFSVRDAAAKRFMKPPHGRVGAGEFFTGDQTIFDFAVVRDGAKSAQSAVPVYFTRGGGGLTRSALRAFLRQSEGVIAADVYISRSGFPTTRSWTADVLVTDLTAWMEPLHRQYSYHGLLRVASATGAVSLNLRLMERNRQPSYVTATLSRRGTGGNYWVEDIDPSGEHDLIFEPMPGGTAIAGPTFPELYRRAFSYGSELFSDPDSGEGSLGT